MFDMKRIEGEQISGLNQEEMEFLEELLQNFEDDTILNQFSALPTSLDGDLNSVSGQPALTAEQEQEIKSIEENAKSKSTSQQTLYYSNKFKSFLKNSNLPHDISTIPVRYLQSYLRLWFVKCRKEDGNMFSTSTYCCMRAAIHRYLCETRQLNLIDNSDFLAFHKTYKAVLQTSLTKN